MNYFFWVFRDALGGWRWRLYAGNRRIIASSGESYKNRTDCEHAIQLIKVYSPGAPVHVQS